MRKFTRRAAPPLIDKYAVEIGAKYAARRATEPNYSFQWPTREKQKMNHAALPDLLAQTGNHCSYCDKFPLHQKDDTIDHFKPKTDPRFYTLVCTWTNMYLACTHCQDSKKTQYNDRLLRPDEVDYEFRRYFTYNYNSHEIEVNPGADPVDRDRAEETRRIFGFNHPGVKTARRHAYERYMGMAAPVLDDFNYRFMFE